MSQDRQSDEMTGTLEIRTLTRTSLYDYYSIFICLFLFKFIIDVSFNFLRAVISFIRICECFCVCEIYFLSTKSRRNIRRYFRHL